MAQKYYTPRVVKIGKVPSTQSNFPALVLLNDARYKTTSNGGHVASANGYDIRFYSDPQLTSALTYELVPGTYSASNGTGEFWVLMSSISDGSEIYIGYGDTSLTSDGSSTSTWPSQYKAVWHLPNGSSLTLADSTVNANTATNHSATSITGQIDGGAGFDGVAQYIDGGTGSSLQLTADLTYSCWINWATNTNAGARLVSKSGGIDGPDLRIDNDPDGQVGFRIADGLGGTALAEVATRFTTSTWKYVVGTFIPSTSVNIYVDGVLGNADTTVVPAASANSSGDHLTIGVRADLSLFFSGNMDEVRISNTASSANWILTEYNNQYNNSAFWSDAMEQLAYAFPSRINGGIVNYNKEDEE